MQANAIKSLFFSTDTVPMVLYQFGFNGQEKDNEMYGTGNLYTAMFWEYDARLGRRWNLDPKPLVSISEYSCFNNNPIYIIDKNGDIIDPWWIKDEKSGKNNFNDQNFMNAFNTAVLKMFNDDKIFRRVVNDLHANKNVHYKVTQEYTWNTGGAGGKYNPNTKTIKLYSESSTSSAFFEEAFHAGQDNFYGAQNRTELQTEFEAKTAKIISGSEYMAGDDVFDRMSVTDISNISKYYKGYKSVSKESFDASMMNLANTTAAIYGCKDQLKNFKYQKSLDYLNDVLSNPDKNAGAMDPEKFSGKND